MNTYQLLLIIQYLTIAVLFLECGLILKNWKNKAHGALFFYCVAALVNSVGYSFVMRSHTESEALLSQQMSYLGRSWIPYALVLFVLYYCKKLTPKSRFVISILPIVHIFTFVCVLTARYHSLYYKNIRFTGDGLFPHLLYESGIWHYIFDILVILYTTYGLYQLFKKYLTEHDESLKKGTMLVITAILSIILFFILEVLGVGESFDVTAIGYSFASVFLYIALTRFDLLDTRKLAQDFVFNRLSEAIIAVDENGKNGFFNEPAAGLFPELETGMETAISKIEMLSDTDEVFEKNGRKYLPEKHVLLKDGKAVGTAYVFTDDTEHIQYLNELEEQKRLADSANKAKSAFLANMSHDIRTPLNAVLGMDEMILRESKEKDTLSYAVNIQSAGRTLLSIINDILDISKVEEGKLEIIPVEYELSSLISDMMNMIRDRAVKKGLALNLKVNEDIPHLLLGDEMRIRQCVMNILTNAVKYTHEGSVTLDVDYEKVSNDSIILKFKVTDTGIGIKKEDMADLFEPFTRIEEKRNRNIEGTGLGMSIVKELLALMDSKLEVSSEYGKGSVFGFGISQSVVDDKPIGNIKERFENLNDVKEYRESFIAPDARIMVVDDTEVNLEVIKNLLKQTKISIDTAGSGRDALTLLNGGTYDCIFIDHMMPDMDGIETLKEMKKLKGTEKTVFVALTANAISGVRRMYLDAGFDDYMSKPVDGEKLENLLMRMLPPEKIKAPEESDTDDEKTGKNDLKTDTLMLTLKEIPGLDTNAGIRNCGSEESFLSVLNVFHDTADLKAKEILGFYRSEDFENYTVKVHALKSSARVIGAGKLSDMARLLEDAGKEKDIEYIRNNTDALLKDYKDLNERLKVLDKRGSKEKISDEEFFDAKTSLLEASEMMDYGYAENTVKALASYELDEDKKKLIDDIKESLMKLDWENIIKLLK